MTMAAAHAGAWPEVNGPDDVPDRAANWRFRGKGCTATAAEDLHGESGATLIALAACLTRVHRKVRARV
jgi:hypothetical protein